MIRPEYISLIDWASSLLVDYSEFNLPILHDEKIWQEWANDLLSVPPFRNNSIPSPQEVLTQAQNTKEAWQEWAKLVYFLMNENQFGQ